MSSKSFIRRTSAITFALVATVLTACGSPGLTDTAEAVNTAPASASLGLNVGISINTPLTGCGISASISLDIGPKGGSISVGGNTLTFPKNAVSALTHITMIPQLGKAPVVQFYPEGTRFNPAAKPTLTMNTDCIGNPANAQIVYTDDAGHIKERLRTTSRTAHTISADLEHFSRYAIDW